MNIPRNSKVILEEFLYLHGLLGFILRGGLTSEPIFSGAFSRTSQTRLDILHTNTMSDPKQNGNYPQGINEPSKSHESTPHPKTARILKRPLDDSDNEDEPSKKRAPRPVSSTDFHISSPLNNTPTKPHNQHPNVKGHYRISISPLAAHHNFSTSTYTLTVFHQYNQLYARFSFDHLSGIMRLLPLDLFNAKTEPWDVYDFVSYCELEEGDVPSRELARWVMRWRGRDGGMRLGEKVGGEAWNRVGDWTWMFEDEDAKKEENGTGEAEEEKSGNADEEKIGFKVVFAYDHKLFSFHGSKIRDLTPDELREETVAKMDKEWHELDDPAWYVDPDAVEEEEVGEEPRSESMFDLDHTPMPPRKNYGGQEWELSGDEAGGEESSPVKKNEA